MSRTDLEAEVFVAHQEIEWLQEIRAEQKNELDAKETQRRHYEHQSNRYRWQRNYALAAIVLILLAYCGGLLSR